MTLGCIRALGKTCLLWSNSSAFFHFQRVSSKFKQLCSKGPGHSRNGMLYCVLSWGWLRVWLPLPGTVQAGNLPDTLSLLITWRFLATFEPLFEGGITSSVSLATFAQFSCWLFVIVAVKQGVALSLWPRTGGGGAGNSCDLRDHLGTITSSRTAWTRLDSASKLIRVKVNYFLIIQLDMGRNSMFYSMLYSGISRTLAHMMLSIWLINVINQSSEFSLFSTCIQIFRSRALLTLGYPKCVCSLNSHLKIPSVYF